MAFATPGDLGKELAVSHTLGQLALDPLTEHHNEAADHFQMAQFLGRDVDQHVLPARIVLRNALGEVAHRCGEFAVRPAELLEEQAGEHRVGLGYPYCVHEPLVVHKHRFTSWRSRAAANKKFKYLYYPAHCSSNKPPWRRFRQRT